ncbi:MAG: YkgJ family cysteine cluster protein [Candidatus Omnitrophota bacterium]|nr:YkgJ family cysteine cluster protein [Candidatus Omnitrophota bacterium]
MQITKQLIESEYCLRCKGCCRFSQPDSVWLPCLLDEEVLGLIDKADLPVVLISADKKIQPVPSPEGEGYICPLLDPGTNKCRIYNQRPFECRLYPFLINLRKKKVLLTLDLNCPYVRENLASPGLKEYTDYIIDFLNDPDQIKTLRDNPWLLQAYEDVALLVELKVSDEIESAGPQR